jgi:3-phenylpropionate/trans-cinnamate dioxygenase ferredoxin subunit
MPNFVRIAAVSELAPGDRLVVEIDGRWIALFNIDGEFHAIADICTHDDGPLAEGELYDHVIECPRHGATFDVRTGEVLSFPAITPIPSYEVKIEGDDVLVALE